MNYSCDDCLKGYHKSLDALNCPCLDILRDGTPEYYMGEEEIVDVDGNFTYFVRRPKPNSPRGFETIYRFVNIRDHDRWKSKFETESCVTFYPRNNKPKSTSVDDAGEGPSDGSKIQSSFVKNSTYSCHRDGKAHDSQQTTGQRSKMRKKEESVKKVCSARYILMTLVGSACQDVCVRMLGSHSHSIGIDNIRYMRINDNLRLKMARMIELGVPKSDIMDRLHKEVLNGGGEHLYGRRFSHISAQDLSNIEKTVLINEHLHKLDTQSTQRLLHNWRQAEDCVLFNKPPNVDFFQVAGQHDYTFALDNDIAQKLRDDGFPDVPCISDSRYTRVSDIFKQIPKEGSIIVIQTKAQRKLYQQYGSHAIYLDSTHSVNQYSYPLMSLVVEDVYGMGRVVAYCICASTASCYVEAFFQAVKNASPDVEPQFVITDDDNAEWCGLRKVFPNTLRLLCQFHVLKAWTERLHKLKVTDDEFNYISKSLQNLIHCNDKQSFDSQFKGFLRSCKNRCPAFYTYFTDGSQSDSYATRKEEWAQYIRVEKGCSLCTTNNFIESFHGVFKKTYLHRIFNKRIDDLLLKLKQHEKDQQRKVIDCFVMGSAFKEDRRKELIERAKSQIRATDITRVLEDEGRSVFNVRSHSDHNVKYQVGYRKNCKCSITRDMFCNHAMSCTCPAFLSTKVPCKHCAAVWQHWKDVLEPVTEIAVMNGENPNAKFSLGTKAEGTYKRFSKMATELDTAHAKVRRFTQRFESLQLIPDDKLSKDQVESLRQANEEYGTLAHAVQVLNNRVKFLEGGILPESQLGKGPAVAQVSAPGAKLYSQASFRSLSKKRGRKMVKRRMEKPTREEREKLEEELKLAGEISSSSDEEGSEDAAVVHDTSQENSSETSNGTSNRPRENFFRSFQEYYSSKINLKNEDERQRRMSEANPSDRDKWWVIRNRLLTSSMFKRIANIRPSTDPFNLLNAIHRGIADGLKTAAILWGKDHEPKALRAFFKLMEGQIDSTNNPESGTVQSCSLLPSKFFIHDFAHYLAATPDGILQVSTTQLTASREQSLIQYLVEVKCPWILRDASSKEDWHGKKNFCLAFDSDRNDFFLDRSHEYYYQIQGQMACSGIKQCYFVVWSPERDFHTCTDEHMHIELIDFDPSFWVSLQTRLEYFYFNISLPFLTSESKTKPAHRIASLKEFLNKDDYLANDNDPTVTDSPFFQCHFLTDDVDD